MNFSLCNKYFFILLVIMGRVYGAQSNEESWDYLLNNIWEIGSPSQITQRKEIKPLKEQSRNDDCQAISPATLFNLGIDKSFTEEQPNKDSLEELQCLESIDPLLGKIQNEKSRSF
jgi:hypothetical protein